MRIAWEEPFGPVVPIMRVDSWQDAVAHCNTNNPALQVGFSFKGVGRGARGGEGWVGGWVVGEWLGGHGLGLRMDCWGAPGLHLLQTHGIVTATRFALRHAILPGVCVHARHQPCHRHQRRHGDGHGPGERGSFLRDAAWCGGWHAAMLGLWWAVSFPLLIAPSDVTHILPLARAWKLSTSIGWVWCPHLYQILRLVPPRHRLMQHRRAAQTTSRSR